MATGYDIRLLMGKIRGGGDSGGAAAPVVKKRVLDDEMLEQLEELLITADMGVETAMRVSANMAEGRFGKRLGADEIKSLLVGNHSFRESVQESNGEETERNSLEPSEAEQQKTAISEILRAISSSPSDLQLILETVAENAARLCDVNDAEIFKVEGDALRLVAKYGKNPLLNFARNESNGAAEVATRCAIYCHIIRQADLTS